MHILTAVQLFILLGLFFRSPSRVPHQVADQPQERDQDEDDIWHVDERHSTNQ